MSAIAQNTALPAGALTTVLAAVPAGQCATVEINVCNTTNTAAKVRLAITSTPANPDAYLEYEMPVGRNPLVRTGQVVKAGEAVVVQADSTGCQVRVSGFQESEV